MLAWLTRIEPRAPPSEIMPLEITPLIVGRVTIGRHQRAANTMCSIQSAQLEGHDPYIYLEENLQPLPTQPANRLDELLPHCPQVHP